MDENHNLIDRRKKIELRENTFAYKNKQTDNKNKAVWKG